jgi:hypothetical protein
VFFPTPSDDDEVRLLLLAPYALRKIERLCPAGSRLWRKGCIIVAETRASWTGLLSARRRKSDRAADSALPDGVYSAVSQLHASIFRLINWKPTPSHTAISFSGLISHSPLKMFNSWLIIGGPAGNIWQLGEHPEHLVRTLGCRLPC